MQIQDNCVVSIHYTLTNEHGEELDSSAGQDPLVYLHGAGNIIPGLESALVGGSVGDKLDVTVAPEDGYGEVDDDLIHKVPRDAFAGVERIEPGMQFQTQSPTGQVMRVTVRESNDQEVVIDANHPLAGQTLYFSVSVEGVRSATEEELAHGHAH
ncbi:MAG: peptidylprolyl isomerase [Gammaproteobacteria bacterium]|nr:peptidylprolyl isomerase [Gammaproteobacteria bacterium]